MSDSQIRTIERFFEMISQPAQTAALNAALRLGVVEALQSGQKTVAGIAQLCDINEPGTLALLKVLTASGMVEQFDQFFALSQAARLTSKSLWAIMFDQWTGLEAALKNPEEETDEPEFERDRRQQKRIDQFKAIHAQIQWASTGVALKVNQALGIGTERCSLNVLDLGCGSAVYSMAIAHHDAKATVHLVDDETGLARARATVNSLDVDTRVQLTESGELVFPGHNETFDLVVIADQIHLWSDEMRTRILATAIRTLRPGGEIAIVDIFPGQDRGELNCHMFDLQLLIGTGRNIVPLKALKEQLESGGFVNIQYADLPVAPFTHGLVLAVRDPGSGAGVQASA